MSRNVSIQTYLPPQIAAWVDAESTRARTSRSIWIVNILTALFQGQELRDERRRPEMIRRTGHDASNAAPSRSWFR
jgi:hypothetical protein